MARASTLGMMVLCTMDTGMKTRSMVLVSIHGLTAEDMKALGKMVSNMARECTIRVEVKSRKESGRMVKGSDGLKT